MSVKLNGTCAVSVVLALLAFVLALLALLTVQVSSTEARSNICNRGHPCTSPTPTPTPTPPSGWTQIFSDDFTQDIPEGSFPAATNGRWWAYPSPWHDTSGNGTYSPQIVSFHDGLMDLHLQTVNGVHEVAAPVPNINGALDRNQLYGRYDVRFKSDSLAGYKTAWLLWPKSETWPRDGEIDFPEGGLNGNICAFMHHQGATSGGDQDAFCTSIPTAGVWHTAVIEWSPTSVRFILDGTLIGTSTSRIPNTPMHWVLQTETNGSPADSVNGHVLIDWVAVWSYS